MQHSEYQEWLKNRRLISNELEYNEPVGSFEFTEDKQQICTFELDLKRPAKYIFLKPTNLRKKPNDYTSKFNTQPIEIVFFGVSGNVIESFDDYYILEKKKVEMNKNIVVPDN